MKTLTIERLDENSFAALLPIEDAQSFYSFLGKKALSRNLPTDVVESEDKGVVDQEIQFVDGGVAPETLALEWMRYGSYKDFHVIPNEDVFSWKYEVSNIRAYLVSLVQHFNHRNKNAEPKRIHITEKVEVDLTNYLVSDGGSLAKEISAKGIRHALPKLSNADLVYGASDVYLE